jgi:hypothetical protein
MHPITQHIVKDIDHPTAFGIIGTLCNYDGHCIDDSDSEELPLALKSILMLKSARKTELIKPQNLTPQQQQQQHINPSSPIMLEVGGGAGAGGGSVISSATSTPKFDQLAQQRKKAEEDKAREKEMLAEQRMKELEARLDALTMEANKVPGNRLKNGSSYSDGGVRRKRRSFLKQPLVIPGPESPDRGPITKDDDDDDDEGVGYGFIGNDSPFSSSQQVYHINNNAANNNDKKRDDHDDYRNVKVSDDGVYSDSSIDTRSIRSDRLQQLRYSGNSQHHHHHRQLHKGHSQVSGGRRGDVVFHRTSEQHVNDEVPNGGSVAQGSAINGSVRVVSRSKYSKSLAWDKDTSSLQRKATKDIHSSHHKKDTQHVPRLDSPRHRVNAGGGGSGGGALVEQDNGFQDRGYHQEEDHNHEEDHNRHEDTNSNEVEAKHAESVTSILPPVVIADKDILKAFRVKTLGAYFGRQIVFYKLSAFQTWYRYVQSANHRIELTQLTNQADQDQANIKLQHELIVNNIEAEKQHQLHVFKSNEDKLKQTIEELNLQLEESNHKLLKSERALQLANHQVMEAENGVAKLVKAESRVAVLQAKADIEAEYAEQLTRMREQFAAKETELRKQVH